MKPFFYAVADNAGKPIMDEICCCESPEELVEYFQDQIDDLKAKVVPVYTGPQIERMREDLALAQLIIADIKRHVEACHDGIGRFLRERIADFERLPNREITGAIPAKDIK